MACRIVLLLGVGSLAALVSAAKAQQSTTYAHFGAFCMGEVVQLTLAGVDDGAVPEVVGFDVWRTQLGVCGATSVRVNDEPISRPLNGQFTLRFEDTGIVSGELYEYRMVGVDAARTGQTDLRDIYAGSTTNDSFFAGCGEVVIGHGTLRDEGSLYSVVPCPGACFPLMQLDPSPLPQLAEYVDTDIPVRLYGRFFWAFGGAIAAPESFEVRACGTALEPSTWTRLKQRYR